MDGEANVIDTRLANALQGGLWIGGKAVLTLTDLTFTPNAMNELFHLATDTLKWSAPLKEIAAVAVRNGVVTDIIDVHLHSGQRSIRCFKAKAFAALIKQTLVAQRLKQNSQR